MAQSHRVRGYTTSRRGRDSGSNSSRRSVTLRNHKQWGEMSRDLDKEYCCCQVFEITHGVYLIALHCVLQAAYAVGLVVTSCYKSQHSAIVYVTAGCNVLLVPTAIVVFWANLYENWKGARVAGVLLFFLAVLNTIMGGLYFFWFFRFEANSQLDKALFWKNNEDWIDSDDLPLTFWHFLTLEFFPINFIWFYYARVLCKLGSILRERKK